MDVQAHNNILDMYLHSARIHTYYIVHSRSLGLAVKTSASRIYADKHSWVGILGNRTNTCASSECMDCPIWGCEGTNCIQRNIALKGKAEGIDIQLCSRINYKTSALSHVLNPCNVHR